MLLSKENGVVNDRLETHAGDAHVEGVLTHEHVEPGVGGTVPLMEGEVEPCTVQEAVVGIGTDEVAGDENTCLHSASYYCAVPQRGSAHSYSYQGVHRHDNGGCDQCALYQV